MLGCLTYLSVCLSKDRVLTEASGFRAHVRPIYDCCYVRLKASDIDQEVKERAISCMGRILAHLGDCLAPQLGECLPILRDRLKNEVILRSK